MLAKTPGFTAVAVAVLALGIGVNTAVFTLVNAMLLQPLNGGRTGEITGVFNRSTKTPDTYRGVSYPDFVDLRDRSGVFEHLAAIDMSMTGVSDQPGVTRQAFVALVSSNYFETLGTGMHRGRGFTPAEERPGSGARVAIASYEYWRRAGLDPSVLGRTFTLAGQPFTMVGIAPEGFTGTMALFSPEFWLPLRALDSTEAGTAPDDGGSLQVIARLQPGVTREEAASSLAPAAALIVNAARDTRRRAIAVQPVSRLSAGTSGAADAEGRGVLLFLLGMTSVVLLIATINLANMLLARGATRQREVGIRLALGAKPREVLGQLLLEALLLSTAGAVAGLGLAVAAVRLLAVRISPAFPFVLAADIWPDARVVVATAVFAAVSALFFGLGPAWHLAHTAALPSLKQAPAASRTGARYRLRNLLVASQLALSLALLTAAALFVHGAWQATDADPGFSLAGGIVATVDPSLAGDDEARGRETYRQALSRLRSMPGVEAASAASVVPFSITSEIRSVRRPERPAEEQWGIFTVVASQYFRTLGLRVLRGREFTAGEESDTTSRVAIVDETLARRLWPDGNALGQRLQVGDDSAKWEPPVQVVGIVPAVRQGPFDSQAEPRVYMPAGGTYRAEMTLHVRVRGGGAAAATLLPRVRRELLAADPRLPILSVKTLEQHRDGSIYMWIAQATARLFTAFALAALALAMLGVYGVKAFLVARQTRDIGIRVALGASHADILRLVLGDSLRLVLAGLGAGLALGVALSRLLTGWVYGLGEVDVVAPIAAAILLAGCTVAASYVPARRALRIAPSVALRTE
jgi:predicted permease